MPSSPSPRTVRLFAFAVAAVAVVALVRPAPAEAQPACQATASIVVGAGAGSLGTRVGVTADCDEPVTLEFTLPGGSHSSFDSDAGGDFMGVVGRAYLCQATEATVGILARGADGSTWLERVPIGTESGQPPATGFGPECDVLLGPWLNFVEWEGPFVTVGEGFSDQTLGNPLSFGENMSPEPLDHIESVSSYDPEDGTFRVWIPGAPAQVNTLQTLMPGLVYVVRSDADIPLTYPQAAP